MSWEILFGVLIAAAAGGWNAIVSVAKSLKVDLAKISQEERDMLIVNHAFKTAVGDAVLGDKDYKAQRVVVEDAMERYLAELAKIKDVVAKSNPFAADCLNVGQNGHVTVKPGVSKVNSVTRTPVQRATVGESVVGVGKGNGNNRFECDRWYVGPFRGVLSGWMVYVSSEDATATAKRQVADRETEIYTFKVPYAEDGSVSARDGAAAILYAMLVEDGKSEVYWGQYHKPAPRARIDGESMSEYLVMCLDFPPGGGVNVGRSWGLKPAVVAG